eukprot:SAG25_NODE_11084_length_314_cov_0.679070_1_plen_104_part_11
MVLVLDVLAIPQVLQMPLKELKGSTATDAVRRWVRRGSTAAAVRSSDMQGGSRDDGAVASLSSSSSSVSREQQEEAAAEAVPQVLQMPLKELKGSTATDAVRRW